MRFSKRWLIILLAVLVIGGLLAWIATRDGPSPADDSYEYVDKDTGETISVQPGVTPEGYGDNEQVTVIGLTSLANFGSASLSEVQLPVFREDLAEKGIAKIGDHDQIIKVVRPVLNPDTLMFEAELIYKDGVAPAKLVFDIPDNYVFEYQILVNGQRVYKSGRLIANDVGEPPH